MIAYFSKDEFGNYEIPIEKQRPIFLMGPPGIGKTAIMEQIASELNVGLVSYSMTHHTRQSALGLPFIVEKTYGGQKYEVSEYTMSEIIASVYDMIETTGHKEGILFLDEINCVSETLAPAMLQFLQYKIFGRHTVPNGWIVVTAGNPPEYNNSVREFDIVTWDRLKRIDVEPDLEIWKEYAYHKGIHASIITYLEIKKTDFYLIETTVDGKSFVTARGWVDLSDMIRLYEKNGIKVDRALIEQYLQNGKIAKGFAVYYDLFNKYKSDYQIGSILSGKADDSIKNRAKAAKFDERLSLLGLILDRLTDETKNAIMAEQSLQELKMELLNILKEKSLSSTKAADLIQKAIGAKKETLKNGIRASSLSAEQQYVYRCTIQELENLQNLLVTGSDDAEKEIKSHFEKKVGQFKKQVASVQEQLTNAFLFIEEVFAEGQEMLILVTDLTSNYYAAQFIAHYGCPEYFKHNKELMFYERQLEIAKELEVFDLG